MLAHISLLHSSIDSSWIHQQFHSTNKNSMKIFLKLFSFQDNLVKMKRRHNIIEMCFRSWQVEKTVGHWMSGEISQRILPR